MKIRTPLIFVTLFLLSNQVVSAQNIYTKEEISTHNTPENCWSIFENKVYDLSDYIEQHDRYLDLRDWCGKDMTSDFQDKAGRNRDHKTTSYSLLETYYIGDLSVASSSTTTNTLEITPESNNEESTNSEGSNSQHQDAKNPYNFILPFSLSAIFYIVTWLISRSAPGQTTKIFARSTVNLFWNTVLVLSLIPSAAFGFFMIL